MNRTVIDETKLYRNVRSGAVVKVLDQDVKRVTIATVKDGEVIGRSRTVPVASFHATALDSHGHTHATGYVPLVNPSQPVTETGPLDARSTMDLIDNLDALSDEDLTELVAKHEKIKKQSGDIAEKAKAIIKARRGDKLGLAIEGNYTLIYKSGEKFDAKTAMRNLNPIDFQRILLPKPDATLARTIFANEPAKLALCMKNEGPSLTVRETTPEDFVKLAEQDDSEQASEDVEEFVM